MKKMFFAATMLLSLNLQAETFKGLASSDDCYRAAVSLAKGIAQSYKVYQNKAAKVVELKLSSETETRAYSLHIDYRGNFDSYLIELSNDSASKCMLEKIEPAEIGG